MQLITLICKVVIKPLNRLKSQSLKFKVELQVGTLRKYKYLNAFKQNIYKNV